MIFIDSLQEKSTLNQYRPAILQTFGDIASAIGSRFETYLSVVGQVLQVAGNVPLQPGAGYELIDYVVSLREGVMDAWSGIIAALRQEKGISS